MERTITTPFTRKAARLLRAGDNALITGTIYTARDAAHQRLCRLLEEGKPLPVDLRDAILYYVGPTPAPPGRVIGSAGPTTSYRMDAYTPQLLEQGLRGMVGKGVRSPSVVDSMKAHGAVYFAAIGGAAALISRSIISAEVVCYEDLGAEAIRRLTVEAFPVTVAIDADGGDIYRIGRDAYLKSLGG